MANLVKSDEERRQDLVQRSLWGQLQRFSRNLIYTVLMRSGGEPFGAPFEVGPPTLTERIVSAMKQRGFFGFETMEKLKNRGQRNKFTRHGAAPYRGPFRHMPTPQASRGVVSRFLTYLQENRFFIPGTGRRKAGKRQAVRRSKARKPPPSNV